MHGEVKTRIAVGKMMHRAGHMSRWTALCHGPMQTIMLFY
jgi:hypothetical protein